MNQQRLISGGFIAAAVMLLADLVILKFMGSSLPGRIFTALVLVDIGIGFVLMWLYALARPRLGPGPRTALKMGTLVWFLVYMPQIILLLFSSFPSVSPGSASYTFGHLLQCWAAAYLAGWQYIERAP